MSVKRKYNVSLSGGGLDDLIRGVNDYKKWLEKQSAALVNRIAQEAKNDAQAGFGTAVYDGEQGLDFVYVDDWGGNRLKKSVVAEGPTALFIEFGTGVVYPDNHPDAKRNRADGKIVGRGEYGHGHGKRKTWWYIGEPGTNGAQDDKRPWIVRTHGNPANMPMYKASRRIIDNFNRIAREVFDSNG